MNLLSRILFVSSLSFQLLWAQSPADSLTQKLAEIEQLGFLPGFAVAIVSAEGVHYQQGFGHADVASQSPYTIHTLQNIGSTSKTLLGLSLMRLVEAGKLSLETPVNEILPFEIVNPHFPDVPITVGHLATHTSSFRDPWAYERTYLFKEKIALTRQQLPKGYYPYIKRYNENEAISVPDFIKNMTHPDGLWYKKRNFLKKKPGSTYHYSNMGAAIAGYIVELVSGQSFISYTQQHILKPLGMRHTGWSHASVDMSNFASLYLSNDQLIPPYELISYADGGLITSVHDLSLYFAAMIKGYRQGQDSLLSHASFQTMMDAAFESEKKNSGIFWTINGKGEYGHSGGDPGIMTYMMFDPHTGIGRIVFTNKLDETGDGINQVVYIWKTLEEFMPRIVGNAKE